MTKIARLIAVSWTKLIKSSEDTFLEKDLNTKMEFTPEKRDYRLWEDDGGREQRKLLDEALMAGVEQAIAGHDWDTAVRLAKALNLSR